MQALMGVLWLLMPRPQVPAEDAPAGVRVRRRATATRPKRILEVRVGRIDGSARLGKAVSR